MEVLGILLTIFLVLWIIVGVGALILLLRFKKVLQQVEMVAKSFLEGLADFSGVLKAVAGKKEVIVGGVTLLAFLKRLFISKKNK